MGHWYLIKAMPREDVGGTIGEFKSALIYPFKYNGVSFDKDNPPYAINLFNSTSPAGVREIAVQPYSGTYLRPGSAYVGGYAGFPRIIYSENALSISSTYVEEMETGVVSGKYQFSLSTGSYTKLAYSTIPVNVEINGVQYKAITFSGNVSKWRGTKFFTSDAIYYGFGAFGDYPTLATSYGSGNAQPSDYIPLFTTAINNGTLRTEYANMLWDFGTGQEVPKLFIEWLNNSAEGIFPYEYTIKNTSGEVLSSISNKPPISAVTVETVGKVKTVTLQGTNGREYTLTWESETPAGKQFLGLAYAPTDTRASIPNGRTTPVNWDGNQTLYEVFGTYRPPVTTFDINLYQSSAEVNRVDKTDFLTGVGTLSGVLREECSIIAPSITFKQTTVPSFNYVYIAAFGRYYYVTGITSVSKDLWRMSLSCDVLMTWKEEIRALTAIIARQENSFNPLLLDSELPAQANQNITVTEFPAGGFSTAGSIEHPFLLTVVGA